jgi:trans-aconitate methyltransferase
MVTSFIYRRPLIYEAVMLALYGRYYLARLQAVAELIPAGASVLDLCCGPGLLYRRYLRHKGNAYCGLDINPRFVAKLRSVAANARVWDLNSPEALPQADYVLMQASLYHFLPDPSTVVDRMLSAARTAVIIAEPVRNLAESRVPILSSLARRHTNAGLGAQTRRFTAETLEEFFARYRSRVTRTFPIPGGREKIYVLSA